MTKLTEEDELFLEFAYRRGYKKGWKHAYLLWIFVVSVYVLAHLLLAP